MSLSFSPINKLFIFLTLNLLDFLNPVNRAGAWKGILLASKLLQLSNFCLGWWLKHSFNVFSLNYFIVCVYHCFNIAHNFIDSLIQDILQKKTISFLPISHIDFIYKILMINWFSFLNRALFVNFSSYVGLIWDLLLALELFRVTSIGFEPGLPLF